jgi:hypothetical protein
MCVCVCALASSCDIRVCVSLCPSVFVSCVRASACAACVMHELYRACLRRESCEYLDLTVRKW